MNDFKVFWALYSGDSLSNIESYDADRIDGGIVAVVCPFLECEAFMLHFAIVLCARVGAGRGKANSSRRISTRTVPRIEGAEIFLAHPGGMHA